MNDQELIRTIREAHDDLGRILAAFEVPDTRDGLTVLQRIRESYNGWPASSSFDGPSARSATDRDGEPTPGHADPTGDAASRIDKARNDRLHLDRQARSLASASRSILDVLTHHILRAANAVERDQTKDPDPGCENCATLTGRHGGPRWEPVYRNTHVGGRMMGLCRFDWEYHRATGTLASKTDLQAHHDGKKVRRPA